MSTSYNGHTKLCAPISTINMHAAGEEIERLSPLKKKVQLQYIGTILSKLGFLRPVSILILEIEYVWS